MAKWNRIISGFNVEDETINFGTRNFAENNGSIYETWTLATIESDNSDNENVIDTTNNFSVIPIVWYEKLCVAVNTCITIFHDQTCQNVLSSICFDSLITSYCLSSDGSYLFVSVEDAMLYCFLLIDNNERQLFSIDFMKEYNCPRIVKVYLQETNNIMDIIVISSIGNIYKINEINRDDMNNEIIDYRDIIKNIDITSINFPVEYVFLQIDYNKYINELSSVDQLSTVIIGKKLYVLPDKICCDLNDLPYYYTKIQFINNYKAMICLRTDGCLSIVCIRTLLGTKVWNGPVKDFIIIQETSCDSYQMLVLMAPTNNESSTLLNLMSFPNFNIIFSISVSSSTYLVDIIGDTSDRLLFLENIKVSHDKLNVIRIKAIEESMPEFRLQRLLRQRRFKKAHEFSIKYNLDVESVYQAEALVYVNCLRPHTNNTDNIDLDTFKTILDKINDIKFIYECCNNTLICDYRDAKNLFEYTRDRIIQYQYNINKCDIDKNDISILLQDINNNLRKLETFEMIQKTKWNNKTIDNIDINEWNKFSKANLHDECIKCLSFGELDAAALLWIRHTSSFTDKITKNIVINMLKAMPKNLQPFELWPWLCHFIPSVTSLFPDALNEIIRWGYKKTKTFETFNRCEWPDIGLKFANGFIELLHFDEYNICFQFHQQYAYKNSEFHQLTRLVQAMSHIHELKLNYKILLPLNIYDDPTNVINLLLAKVHVDCIGKLMENFLQQYMLNNSIQNDKVLSHFIQNTLKNSKDWWLWERAPWDKRLSVVITYIHNIQNRLQQTLQVLKKAPVPWSDALIQLAEQSYVYDHPLVSKIRYENNCIGEKLILKKYGFAHIRNQSLKLYHNIVKQNRSTMIDDIFELTKTDRSLRMTILHFCINYHLKHNNIDKIIDIFQQLDNDDIIQCCKQLIYVTQTRLNFLTRQNEPLKYYIIFEILGTVEAILRKLIVHNSQYPIKVKIFCETIPNIRNLYHLYDKFNVCTTINTYIREKNNILIDYINKLTDNNIDNEKNWQNICVKVSRVNNLLHLPKFYGLYHLLNVFKHSTKLKLYVSSYLADNKIIFNDELNYASKICLLLVEEPDNDMNIVANLLKIYSSIILSTDKKHLSDNLRLGRYIDVYNESIGSQTYDNTLLMYPTIKNSIRQLYPIYRDASVSSGWILLPLFHDCLKILSFYRYKIQHHHDNLTSTLYNDETSIELICESIIEKIQLIKNEHHDYSMLKIITAIYFELCSILVNSNNNKSIMKIQLAFNHCVSNMLKKTISSRVFDLQLGLTCLFLLPETEIMKSLSSIAKFFHSDNTRDQIINDLGYEYCRLTNDINQMEKFKFQRVLHYWGQRLINYDVSYREVVQSDTIKKQEILHHIMMSNKSDIIELLRDFCDNFGFNMDDCYLAYLKTLLCSWCPKYNTNIPIINSNNELKICDNDVNELTLKCKKIATYINDKIRMKRHLIEMITQINFYHYEIFLILLELGENKKIETMYHLCFLKNYTRIGEPTDIEYEEWGKFSQENQTLPDIAKWRLPFLPKVDQYKLITPELNLNTYEKWLTIAGVLKIPIHNICTLAVKGAVTDAWKVDNLNSNKNNSVKWSINLRNSALLKDIKKCIGYMTGLDGLHYGTAALYYVVNHTPPGADLVAAAKECFIQSQLWQQLSNESATSVITKLPKIEKKYTIYASKHVLYMNGLGDEKYLNLVENPEKLVRELYKNETIPNRYKCAISNRPDINSAVDALNSIIPLNLTKIRLELLNEWLQPWDNCNDKANDSITTNLTHDLLINITNDLFTMHNNFFRACYIVGSANTESFINYLINIGFPENSDDCYDTGVRFRALRVLQSVTDEITLQDYVKRDINTVNQYVKILQYLSELERLGLGYSINGFDTCSKLKLAELLINTQYCTSRALILIPQLYIDYKIDDYGPLVIALERMVQLSLVKELKKIILMIKSIDSIVDSSGYIAAWQTVINDAFNKLDIQSSVEAIACCIEALRMLHACPVINKLEFNGIIRCCIRAKLLHLAIALLPFINNITDKDYIIQEVKQCDKLNETIDKLLGLKINGILIVHQAMAILQHANIFLHEEKEKR